MDPGVQRCWARHPAHQPSTSGLWGVRLAGHWLYLCPFFGASVAMPGSLGPGSLSPSPELLQGVVRLAPSLTLPILGPREHRLIGESCMPQAPPSAWVLLLP